MALAIDRGDVATPAMDGRVCVREAVRCVAGPQRLSRHEAG